MWNCIVTTRRSSSEKKKGKPAKKAEPNGQILRLTSSTSTIKPSDHILDGTNLDLREKRTSNGDNNGYKSGGDGVMRIRVVVTQSQLSQILKESRNSSSSAVKQLLLTSVIKMSNSSCESSLSRTTSRDDQGGNTNGKWRPRLNSIPED